MPAPPSQVEQLRTQVTVLRQRLAAHLTVLAENDQTLVKRQADLEIAEGIGRSMGKAFREIASKKVVELKDWQAGLAAEASAHSSATALRQQIAHAKTNHKLVKKQLGPLKTSLIFLERELERYGVVLPRAFPEHCGKCRVRRRHE